MFRHRNERKRDASSRSRARRLAPEREWRRCQGDTLPDRCKPVLDKGTGHQATIAQNPIQGGMMTSANAVRAVFTPDSKAVSAFDYLLAHAKAAGFVWVPRAKGAVLSVELQWADRRLNPFSAQAHADHINFYLRRPILKKHVGSSER